MNEMDDQKLEQVAGGGELFDFEAMWAEYQKKNCGGCTTDDARYCGYTMDQFRTYVKQAMKYGFKKEAPRCNYKK